MKKEYLFSSIDNEFYNPVPVNVIEEFEAEIGHKLPGWVKSFQILKGGGITVGNFWLDLNGVRKSGPEEFYGLLPKTLMIEDFFKKVSGKADVMVERKGENLLERYASHADYSDDDSELPFATDGAGGQFIVSLKNENIIFYAEGESRVLSKDFATFLSILRIV